jgi:hypothetical protein
MLIDLCKAMSIDDDIVIDLNSEGCDCKDIGLYDLIDQCAKKFDYDISKISIHTNNVLERHEKINIKTSFTWSLMRREAKIHANEPQVKQSTLKHFGRFIGRSNAPRLILSTYLDEHHPEKTLGTFHYNPEDDFHKDFAGLESIINDFQITNIESHARFLASCPRSVSNQNFRFQVGSPDDHYTQMLAGDRNQFVNLYSSVFVDIVSESFYNGNTFFVTEKTYRPMLCLTPFIIQGPTGFLKNLKNFGFKTFDKWWDEGYDEDPPAWAIKEIIKVIEHLASKSQSELRAMLLDMQDVLAHNRNLIIEMDKKHVTK